MAWIVLAAGVALTLALAWQAILTTLDEDTAHRAGTMMVPSNVFMNS
jgi:hypothetical protein